MSALACPGPGDLDKGVIFKTKDGTIETHRRFAKDWILIETEFNDGGGSLLEAAHGLYLHSSTAMEEGKVQLGSKEVFSSRPDLAQWDKPSPGTAWRNESATGGTAKSGPAKSVKVGDCTFAAFDVTLTFKDDPTYTENYVYLRDLGVGLLVSSISNGAKDVYTYISAEKAP